MAVRDRISFSLFTFFFNDTATTEIYTLSLHDALPIPDSALHATLDMLAGRYPSDEFAELRPRSEKHTSELQSHHDLVCRLLLEKKKKKKMNSNYIKKKIIINKIKHKNK